MQPFFCLISGSKLSLEQFVSLLTLFEQVLHFFTFCHKNIQFGLELFVLFYNHFELVLDLCVCVFAGVQFISKRLVSLQELTHLAGQDLRLVLPVVQFFLLVGDQIIELPNTSL